MWGEPLHRKDRVQTHRRRKMKSFFIILVPLLLCGTSVGLFRNYTLIYKSIKWSEAQRYCRQNYTDLATITTAEEQNRLVQSQLQHVHLDWAGENQATLKHLAMVWWTKSYFLYVGLQQHWWLCCFRSNGKDHHQLFQQMLFLLQKLDVCEGEQNMGGDSWLLQDLPHYFGFPDR